MVHGNILLLILWLLTSKHFILHITRITISYSTNIHLIIDWVFV